MTSWFRSWHGAPTDNKWLVIAAKAQVKPGVVSAVAWALFDYASQADDRGSVADFDTETYAVFSGFAESDVQAVIAAMRAKGVITEDDRLAAWDKRQPKREDDSADRVREYRNRQKSAQRDVTQCNAESRTVTQRNNTEPETDTEKKRTDNNKSAADPVVVVVDDSARYRHACDMVYQNGFGMMTPIMAEQVHAMLDDFPDEWIDKAFEIAVRANKRRLDYVIGTLENLRRDGFDPKRGKVAPAPNGKVSGFDVSQLLGGA